MKEKPETFKAKLARLRAKRDAIRAGIRNPRPARTPFSLPFRRKK